MPVCYTCAPIRVGGALVGLVIYFQDITESKRVADRIKTEYELTKRLAEPATLLDSLHRVLETVCKQLSWDAGLL